jgi:ATP-dependent exoDNAse (exonuclease V) beta subunit
MVAGANDRDAREAALDTGRSFIVQAPAGSGKTELLIQRYLALLGTVEEPEQVVAITFTRKAAAEMRRRVLQALRAVAGDEHDREVHPITHALATTVVRRDTERDWSLQALPQRLRVDTLDAFNAALARQLPLLADGVAAAEIAEDATRQYRLAALRTVAELEDRGVLGSSLRRVLGSLDNDQSSLVDLLAGLLPKREQWLGHLAGRRAPELRAALEHSLQHFVADELRALDALWSDALRTELDDLLAHAAANITAPATRGALAEWLSTPQSFDPAVRLAGWQAAARLLLTQDGRWRQKVTKREGLGPEHPVATNRWRALLAALPAHEQLRRALRGVAALPAPRFDELQWESLAALQVVLVRLCAELKVVLAEQRCVDFVELGVAAQRALGHAEAPSELLLALDRRIQHLLVDEFQDTSQAQLRLLELLTSGWQPGDGRSLFLVGDPMQSIYRFRDADMSLFLRVQASGVGALRLTPLRLRRNFRSSPAVIDWVNRVFASVFPQHDDLEGGMAAFVPSTAVRESAAQQFVRVHPLWGTDPRAEVERVMDIVREERARDEGQSIAVLVQSRTHLAGLHELLDAQGWPVLAVEIDAPSERQIGQDLLGLTRALTHLADRIAWLGVLRAPWCGLSWSDLHELCHDEPQRTILDLLGDPRRVARLSAAGQRRVAATAVVLAEACASRASLSLSSWIEATWRHLDGPACADTAADLRHAEQFFAILARHEQRGDLDDPAALESLFAKAERQGDPPREAGIEIMTMHRAKGLEFDTVVLLGLGRPPRQDDSKALYWMQRATAGGYELLMAPMTSLGDDDRLTRFVKRAERQRDVAERARLLYVAATRARERLHLVGQVAPAKPTPATHTLLGHLWPEIEPEFARVAQTAVAEPPPTEVFRPQLRRLAESTVLTLTPPMGATGAAQLRDRPEFAWSSPAAVHIGTVVHRHLQRIAADGVGRWTAARIGAARRSFGRELALLGVDTDELPLAVERVTVALTNALDDSVGRWALTDHPEARSELRLALRSTNGLAHIKLDRTFVEANERWIIDYKTGQHEGGDIDAFLASEVERYKPQLERYAAAIAAIDSRKINLALYFPLLRAFRSWPAVRREN